MILYSRLITQHNTVALSSWFLVELCCTFSLRKIHPLLKCASWEVHDHYWMWIKLVCHTSKGVDQLFNEVLWYSVTYLKSMLGYKLELPIRRVSSIKKSARSPQRSLHCWRWAIEVSSSSITTTQGTAVTPRPRWPAAGILTSCLAPDSDVIM